MLSCVYRKRLSCNYYQLMKFLKASRFYIPDPQTYWSNKYFSIKKNNNNYNLIQVIYEELSHSQGPPRCCLLESLKRSHKGQHQTWLKF